MYVGMYVQSGFGKLFNGKTRKFVDFHSSLKLVSCDLRVE